MFRLSDFFYQKTNGKWIAIFAILFMLFGMVIIPHYAAPLKEIVPSSYKPFDLLFFYDYSYAQDFIGRLGEGGIRSYLIFSWVIDFFYPMVYGGLLIFVLSYIFVDFSFSKKWHSYVNILPLGIMLIDYIENAGIAYMLTSFPNFSALSVFMVNKATQLKWLIVVVCIFFVIVGLVRILRKKL